MPSTLILCAATATLAVAIAAAMVHRTRRGGRDAVVVVLGDLGHSPRMCLHAQSLADRFQREHSARRVRVVSYLVSAPPHRLAAHPFVAFHPLRAPQRITAANPLVYVATAALRILVQLAELARILFCVLPAADVMLVQNPPAIPTLAVAQLVRILRGTRLIIDWHNFGFSIMAMGKSSHSPVVKLAKWYEMTFGRNADGHLCVTQAMANHLNVEWNITGKCVTLYDRSPSHFRRLSLPEAHDFLTTLEITSQHTLATTSTTPNFPQTTLLTTRVTPTSMPAPTTKRPALIVSSTSWTPDEDFSILLDALARYDASAGPRHADLVVVVTGKGPLKAHYEGLVRGMRWTKVRVLTAWLRVEDYPRLLGCADLGVCLHTSSSGLDLPMKIVDMFGCELPVCAVSYPCLAELVRHEENGLVFEDAEELCKQLLRLFEGFSLQGSDSELARLRKGTCAFQAERWNENWERNVGELFL